MYPSNHHLPPHPVDPVRLVDHNDCSTKPESIIRLDLETIHSYNHHHCFSTDNHNANAMWLRDSVPYGTVSSLKRKVEAIDLPSIVRKDKHSKVCTAKGPRDRRVRLSPKTAIQFYDVQDRLGYDRPSKAIDWLIKEAKAAIDALNQKPLLISSDNSYGNYSQIIRKSEEFEDENPVSGFGFFMGAAAASPELQIFPEEQGILSALTVTNARISDTNWDVGKGQKLLTWNCGTENSGNARGERVEIDYSSSPNSPSLDYFPNLGNNQAFSETENLNSSINFPGFGFESELSNITIEREKSPILHYYQATHGALIGNNFGLS